MPNTPDVKPRIDLNRGVRIMRSKKTGIQVFMYKDEPGVFRSATGGLVGDDLAFQAGYDIVGLTKERERRTRIREATEQIDLEYRSQEREMIREASGMGLEKVGKGKDARYNVIDMETTQPLNSVPLSLAMANKIMGPGEEVKPKDGDVQRDPDKG